MSESGQSVVVDTRTVAPGDGLEYWAGAMTAAVNPLRMASASPDRFQATLRGGRLASFEVYRIRASASTMTRSMHEIAAGDPGCVQFSLLLSGRMACEQQRRRVVIGPGQLTSYDTSVPAVVQGLEPFEMIALRAPKQMLGLRGDESAAFTATRIPCSAGWTRLAASVFSELGRGIAAGELDGDDQQLAGLAGFLLERLFAQRELDLHGFAVAGNTTVALAQQEIERRLGDPTLSPMTIAAACHVSLRALHYAFVGEQLTVGGWIRERRLERTRLDLADRRLAEVPIRELAARHGFSSQASFCRQFRERYGCSPSQWRVRS